jgi:dynein heavy chain
MVPNYAMIANVMLYSFGYTLAPTLSVKIVATYTLCSEQLSSQRHYDFGLRAVIAVLRASANLKGKPENADTDENILVLRAIIDVNLPKFLAFDVPLFNGITSDLFPGVVLPVPDRSLMLSYFERACSTLNLKPTPYFIGKVFEVYDMMIVRHGFMIVGYPFGAKTSNWKVLQMALTMIKAEIPDNPLGVKVVDVLINPKSILMGQLYGNFDPQTKEWTDGILAIGFRACAHSGQFHIGADEDRKWIMFDGPVDAIWIENMNTVLDDNKKLCLQSGEMIVMNETMSMIFEVQDLEVASPATVSRVGVIFVEPIKIGWLPLAESWLRSVVEPGELLEAEQTKYEQQRMVWGTCWKAESGEQKEDDAPFRISAEHGDHLMYLFKWLFDPCVCFVTKNCKFMVPTLDQNLLVSMMNLLESTLEEVLVNADNHDHRQMSVKRGDTTKDEAKTKLTPDLLEAAFCFSLIWSIGAITDKDGRVKFDTFLRDLVASNCLKDVYPGVNTALLLREWTPPEFPNGAAWGKMKSGLPKNDSVYDSAYSCVKGKWVLWLDTIVETKIPATASFSSIVVPTTTTAQLEFLLDLLLTHGKATLVVGPTGTGKSVFINAVLSTVLPQETYNTISVNFSAKTTANMTQNIIDGKLGKRRKGVYGPPMGQKAVIFVDDMNMPEVEEYGAQPPIEILRQLIGNDGWYDKDSL